MKNIHPLQSSEWGEFRKKTGIKVIWIDGVQMTVHKIPYLPWTIGYIPKGPLPTKEMISALKEVGKKENCIFIQLEPNLIMNNESGIRNHVQSIIHDSKSMIHPSAHPLFTKYTFILDLTKSEAELLKGMHPKTRYNIRIAQKHNVEIVEDNSDEAFEEYLKLTRETTKRQGFYAHTQEYHRLMWQALGIKNQESGIRNKKNHDSYFMIHNSNKKLTAHLFLAYYSPSPFPLHSLPLVAWILFVYGGTLYYPYGASSSLHRETMASNLMMWEAIKFGKKLGLKKFDMWGALGPNPDPKDPWFGFNRFKQGYGPKLVELVGSFDLIINPILYQLYKLVNKLRWLYLKIK